MRIGVFGGSFDPPHSAHLQVAATARRQLKLDKVIWVPALQPPHKDAPATPFEHRCGMVQALITEAPSFEFSGVESALPKPSYTLHTLRALKESMGKEHEWFLIIGADNWAIFPQWHQPGAVLQEASLVVYPRLGIPVAAAGASACVLDCEEIPMESRQFRELLKSNPGQALASLPASVAAYIREHQLYDFSSAVKS